MTFPYLFNHSVMTSTSALRTWSRFPKTSEGLGGPGRRRSGDLRMRMYHERTLKLTKLANVARAPFHSENKPIVGESHGDGR